MQKTTFRSDKQKVILSFISIILFVYIILFEFILPANKLLPKPSILLESVPALFQEYDFLTSFLFTFTAIYSIMLLSYFLIRIGYKVLYSMIRSFPGLKELFIIGKYFFPLFLILLFNLWFGNSYWGQYLFILIIVMGLLKSSLVNEFNFLKDEYLDSGKSLGLNQDRLLSDVIWKSIQPGLFSVYLKEHISIWGFVIIYEYICETDGLGYIFNKALKYNDLSLIIVVIVIIILTFLIYGICVESNKEKIFLLGII